MRHHKTNSSAVAIAVGTIAILYFFLYPVRELIAATILFSIVFAIVWTSLLLLFVMQYMVVRGTRRKGILFDEQVQEVGGLRCNRFAYT